MADKYDLTEVIAELQGGHEPIVICADGRDFRVLPAELWPDDALTLGTTDPVAAARTLMMDDDYDDFTAAGGSAGVLMHIISKEAAKAGKA